MNKESDPINYTSLDRKGLIDWFIRFAETECKDVSPLYYQLSYEIAKSSELIEIAAHTKYRQPMPNMFFASVHYLLLKNSEESLAAFYPSIVKKAIEEIPFDLSSQFVVDNQDQIKEIIASKITQTNALNRTAYLMPILSSLFENRSVNLIDIGTSAGLTLNMDLYKYDYHGRGSFGNGEVNISSDIKDGNLPNFQNIVSIKKKIGLD